jgi:hypothetical protein
VTDATFDTEPIVGVVARWHDVLRGRLPGGLDELLHDDVVFFSPIVFTPQEGKALTKEQTQKIAELMRYHSSKSGEDLVSFKEYVDRMKEGLTDVARSMVPVLGLNRRNQL